MLASYWHVCCGGLNERYCCWRRRMAMSSRITILSRYCTAGCTAGITGGTFPLAMLGFELVVLYSLGVLALFAGCVAGLLLGFELGLDGLDG